MDVDIILTLAMFVIFLLHGLYVSLRIHALSGLSKEMC